MDSEKLMEKASEAMANIFHNYSKGPGGNTDPQIIQAMAILYLAESIREYARKQNKRSTGHLNAK